MRPLSRHYLNCSGQPASNINGPHFWQSRSRSPVDDISHIRIGMPGPDPTSATTTQGNSSEPVFQTIFRK
jgi:hypothetical protein